MKFVKLFFLSLGVFIALSCHTALASSYRITQEASLPTGKSYVTLQANTIVTLNSNNHVIAGTLAKDQFLSCARISLRFKAGSEIWFDDNGNVIQGTLLANESIANGSVLKTCSSPFAWG